MTDSGLQARRGRALTCVLAACALALVLAAPGAARAFGEEHGSDIDTEEYVSTHHLYLTRALAVCAGFATSGKPDPFDAAQDAERIAIADQLSDSEALHHGDAASTNCSAKPYALPTPTSLGCPAGTGTSTAMPVTGMHNATGLLPVPKWHPEAGCFTSRYGPYSNDFHFPDAQQVAVLRAWAFGESTQLPGTAQFAFGGWFVSPWHADCHATRKEIIDTGAVQPGSIDALGIYLHVLGDFHSHAPCRAGWGTRKNPPWPTHTLSTQQTGCAFIDHAREFGCPANSAHDSMLTPPPGEEYVQHSVQAALDVYDALRRYGAGHGITPRLGDSPASRDWLARQSRRFVTGWSYLGGAQERRDFANVLMNTCLALTPAVLPADLPVRDGETPCQ